MDSRLLRAEPFPRGGYAYELSHDRLIPAVLEAREESRQAKAREEAVRQEEALRQEKARREEAEAQRVVAEQAKRRTTWFARGAGALALVAILLAVYAVQ